MTAAWASARWWLACRLSRLGIFIAPFTPTPLAYAVGGALADAAFFFARRPRRNLVANLSRVVGEERAEAAARQAFRHFARYVIDLHQWPSLGREELARRVRFDDWQRLDAALDNPAGTLFVTLHLGHYEAGAVALTARGHKVNVIAQPLTYAPMNDVIQGLRSRLGLKIIPARKAKLGALRGLGRGEVLGMLFDAVAPGEGIAVDFLGRRTEVSAAPARIALRTGARVLTSVMSRDPHDERRLVPGIDYDFCFEPRGDEDADVRALTQAIAASLERFVRCYPEQWYAFRPLAEGVAKPEASAGRSAPAWMVWSLGAASTLGSRMPRRASYALARAAGDLAFQARAKTRADVIDNMRHVLGAAAADDAVEAAAREVFRNVARYYTDLVRLPTTTPARLLEGEVRLHGLDGLRSAAAAGRGVVVATAHFGNPEMAVQIGAEIGLDVLVFVEPLQPPEFAEMMRRIRSTFSPRYVEVGYGAIAAALRHLRSGGVIAIAADRDIQGRGAVLPFFGAPTRLPLGAVEIAARTGALLVPAYSRRRRDGFDIYFEETLELVATGHQQQDALVNAARLLKRIEAWIGGDPGQWMVLERVWKDGGAAVDRALAAPARERTRA